MLGRKESKRRWKYRHGYFDFAQLSLEKLTYDVIPVGIAVRGLMKSRFEWKGTAAELLAELKGAAKSLKIDTKKGWPESSYKFNQILRELKTYLVEFGIMIEKGRYARTIKIWKAPIDRP